MKYKLQITNYIIFILFLIVNLFINSIVLATPLTDSEPLAKPPQLSTKWENIGLDINLGGTYLSGNVNFINLNSKLLFNANYLEHSIFVDTGNMFNYSDDKIILNKINASLLYAYSFHENLNFYFSSTHAYNQFSKLDYRLSNGVGICVHKFLEPAFSMFLVSAGVNLEHEWFQQNIKNQAWAIALRSTFDLPVTEYVNLGSDFIYTPRLHDFGDFRIYEEAYLKFKITDNLLSFKLSLTDEYNSRPQPEVKNNDFGILGSLIFHFGN